ncbi:hypothetical protein [Streptomyces flavofungini]|uniref:hypothetical protein n=1 Tax=Streptomyces flavofungini TaxID=68200 RepID=UPI0025B25D78|nr:hypothetical protein [Streptomyces flavofungini]WJV49925.1 hypothetical protein QUY26_33025 [Streptomyces flavofungini]
MNTLPDDSTLIELSLADYSDTDIARMYGVTQQAVTKRLAAMNIQRRGAKGASSIVARYLPWDISGRDDVKRLNNQAAYTGLRYFIREKLEGRLTPRGEFAVGVFKRNLMKGFVVDFDDAEGFVYRERRKEDGNLVVRWPSGQAGLTEDVLRVLVWDQDSGESGDA